MASVVTTSPSANLSVQFYRQKPLGNYTVDFYAPRAKLVMEVDGSRHYEAMRNEQDQLRTSYLEGQGLQVLRFSKSEVFSELEAVIGKIYWMAPREINPPLAPLFQRGGLLYPGRLMAAQ